MIREEVSRTILKCEHCLEILDFYDPEMMEEHESTCTHNPAMKACRSCKWGKLAEEMRKIRLKNRDAPTEKIECAYMLNRATELPDRFDCDGNKNDELDLVDYYFKLTIYKSEYLRVHCAKWEE